MKKIIAMLLAIAMIMALAACGSGAAASAPAPEASEVQGSAEPASEVPEEAPADAEASAEPDASEASAGDADTPPAESSITYPISDPITLTALGAIYQPRTADKITSWSEALVYVKSAEATGVTIDMTCVASNAQQEQTQLTIASGDLPDLMTNLNMYYQVADLLEQDIIIDLAGYLDEYAPDYMAAIHAGGYEKAMVTDDGASPCTYYINEGVPNTGMYIRKDLLDEAGLDVPVTYEDYDKVMAAFKDMGIVEPFAMDATSTGASDVYNAGLGIQLFSHPIMGSGNDGFYQVDGEVKFGYLEDGFDTYITQMADWFSKGYINPDYITVNENNNSEEFTARVVNGEIATFTGNRTNLDVYNQQGKENNPDFELIPIASPRVKAGDEIHLAPYRESSLSGGFFATSACDDEKIQALLAWHNYWFTEEGNLLTNYGVEGETYNMVDGKPVFTDMITNNPEGLTLTQTTYIYLGSMGVVDTDRENQWYSESFAQAAEVWSEGVDNAWKIPGSTSMTADEASAYSSKFSDIQTYISEKLPAFVNGTEPIENVDAFQDTLRDMGIEDCIALWQDAVDRYNAR